MPAPFIPDHHFTMCDAPTLLFLQSVAVGFQRLWIAGDGTVLCSDEAFNSTYGYNGADEATVHGMKLSEVFTDPAMASTLLDTCAPAHAEDFKAGLVTAEAMVVHRYGALLLHPQVCCGHLLNALGVQLCASFMCGCLAVDPVNVQVSATSPSAHHSSSLWHG